MEYCAVIVGVSWELFDYLNGRLAEHGVMALYALTVTDGLRLFTQQTVHLILIDLQGVRAASRPTLLAALRQAKFVPIFALTDRETPEDIAWMLDFGIDLCLPRDTPPLLIAKYAKALIRRYTAYNHYDQPESSDTAPIPVRGYFY